MARVSVTLARAVSRSAPSPQRAVLYLRKREERRLRSGHPWVFSNEVDVQRSPLTGFEPGQEVDILASGGRWLASGYVNPHSLICARVVSRRAGETLGRELLLRRLREALALRERLYAQPFYRLAFGESDALPGLVVDRYGEVLAVQIGTAGMERLREEIVAALDELLAPRAVVLRNDLGSRALEGLDQYVETALGQVTGPVLLEEHGARFEVDPRAGQKTGWYFDHRPNRARLGVWAGQARVLDVFAYTGAWGVQAAVAGAAAVLCVDSSAAALEQARHNAALNGVESRVDTRSGDAFEVLRELHAAGERYEVVVLDPPAFIRRRRDQRSGEEAYRRVNRLAAQLLGAGGILVSASCSAHLARERLRELLAAGAHQARRGLQIVEAGEQGPDHPLHPALPETAYLKLYWSRILEA